jgi:signal transduction histidine kinase
MADLCVPTVGQACILYVFGEGVMGPGVAATRHVDPVREKLLETLARRAFNQSNRRQVLFEVAARRRPAVLPPLRTAALMGDGRPVHTLQSDLQLKIAVLVPVANGEHVLGLVICLSDSTRTYTPRLIRMVGELTDRFALALAAAQTYTTCKTTLDTTHELLSTTIHDVMSPLTYVKGCAQQLRRLDWSGVNPSVTAEFEGRLGAIDAAVTRAASTLSALVETTRPHHSTSGPVHRAHKSNLLAIARDAIDMEQLMAPHHRMRLVSEVNGPLIGIWNADQIRRMIDNLVSNAVKYSEPGARVELQLGSDVHDEGSWAVIRVTDEGIGIPAGDLPFVCEPFLRGSNVGHVRGTGLGLSSVRQAVRAHHGRLWVESEEGKGTCVTVRLPLVPDAQSGRNAVSRRDALSPRDFHLSLV